MYTDGVTEAFSADGDLYGEQKLCQTIDVAATQAVAKQDRYQISAIELLDVIDRSVSEFIGEAPLSDDLTLLVIKRLPPI
jgi:serine phosphatase RsbU (regulator of sigma subunit)